MALRSQIKLDLKKISGAWPSRFSKGTELLGHFSKQLNEYEKRVAGAVKNLDLKSREARERSRKRLDTFISQLRKTRTDVEKRVVKMVNQEAQRINVGVNDLVKYLRKTAKVDQEIYQPVRAAAASTTSAPKKKKKATRKTKTARRKTTARRKKAR